ncbi:Lrp/AsnC family transcriptional regulator [Brevundimonas sp. SL130]|uniref:Lrp/AsnC family transcriptional regulator n=1 Tax=Brevundimonas sp. SL130 TaxID=2995143 RepID=UPI00226CBAC9|nr:Lrp/AsnC family transcriptional regulator [Brevundimonas sp. SL130]WAC60761.1 Lrp/AsnC family transcriptional regulator [Brevundimonas sp. SL130]
MTSLDVFDRKILAALQEAGDAGPSELAPIVGLSPSQISRRLQILRKDGVIRSIHAHLSPAALNVGIMAYVMLTMTSSDPQAASDFRKRLILLDEVLECQLLTGSPDMIIKVATKDLSSLNILLTETLLSSPQIANGRTSIILQDVKSSHSLPLRFC